jgi:hypothetical protein
MLHHSEPSLRGRGSFGTGPWNSITHPLCAQITKVKHNRNRQRVKKYLNNKKCEPETKPKFGKREKELFSQQYNIEASKMNQRMSKCSPVENIGITIRHENFHIWINQSEDAQKNPAISTNHRFLAGKATKGMSTQVEEKEDQHEKDRNHLKETLPLVAVEIIEELG